MNTCRALVLLPVLALALDGCAAAPETLPERDEAAFVEVVRGLGGVEENLTDEEIIESGDAVCEAARSDDLGLDGASEMLGATLEAQGADARQLEYWAATSDAAQYLCPELAG